MTVVARVPLDAEAVITSAGVRQALLAHRGARLGLVVAAVLALAALVGPLLTGEPNATNYAQQLQGPSGEHLLGTDRAGRDLLARTFVGARSSLGAALLVMAISTSVGLLVGVLAGSLGGVLDAVLTRVTDVMLGLPSLVLTLALVGVLGPSLVNLVLAMSVTSWASLAKLTRSYARGTGSRPDIIAARMAGVSRWRVVLGHVLPGALSLALVAGTLRLGAIVVELASLSFLGLGAQPPTAEWGNMLSASRETLSVAPFQILGPGVGLVLTVLAATLISDALRDANDPGRRT